jgi:N-acetylglucosamine-6-phosphate deacetylase
MEITANVPSIGLCTVKWSSSEIVSVEPLAATSDAYDIICPGFFDTQINGYMGLDFSNPETTPEAFEKVIHTLWATGVTHILPTVISNSIDHLHTVFQHLEMIRKSCPAFDSIAPGYHLEGPFLSDGPSAGAHLPQWMRDPDWDTFASLNTSANGRIRLVTIAPERQGTVAFTTKASAHGIVVGISHTDGTCAHVHAAATAGARLNTHLGNGCPQSWDRHTAPFWAQLNNDSLMAGLICDGFHLSDEMIRLIARVKGLDNCILVSDAVHVGGMKPGRYSLQGKPIELLPSGQVITADRKSMAGSTLTMDAAVSHFCAVTNCSWEEALACANTVPARLFRDAQVCTTIAPGQPATFILCKPHEARLQVLQTFVKGKEVYRAPQHPSN